ncbi:MAG: hypothetical protein JSV80_16700 [Acidobacteriota bacterium]|nr:MAG: hypothetical protein JSV80_16700 [Acidobacteriota bacterium]
MQDHRWTAAGWIAIGSAVLIPPNVLLSLLADTVLRRSDAALPVTFIALLLGAASMILGLVALYLFRELLHARFEYHGVDLPIGVVLWLGPLLILLSSVGRVISAASGPGDPNLALVLPFLIPMILIAVSLGVVSIIIGVKLLSLRGEMQGLMQSYAILSIAEGACFAIFILAPLGLLLVIAEHIVLALMFFRANEAVPSVEYV